MPRRGPSEADLYLLYGFASALVFLMGIIIVMRSRGRRMYDVEARGVALDWDGLKHLYRTGTYDVREREAWDSPAARATLTGIRRSKERQNKNGRGRSGRRGEEGGARRGIRRGTTSRPASTSRRPAGAGLRLSGRAAGRRRLGLAARHGRRRIRRGNGWGPDQIADEIRAHIGRLDAGAQATFRRRLGAAGGDIDALADLNEAVQEAAADYARRGRGCNAWV